MDLGAAGSGARIPRARGCCIRRFDENGLVHRKRILYFRIARHTGGIAKVTAIGRPTHDPNATWAPLLACFESISVAWFPASSGTFQ